MYSQSITILKMHENYVKDEKKVYTVMINIPPISKYDVGNPGPGLGQALKCGRVEPVSGIPTLSFL
jgi:hypothetical protein